jgi:hypothetical protein
MVRNLCAPMVRFGQQMLPLKKCLYSRNQLNYYADMDLLGGGAEVAQSMQTGVYDN